MRKSTLLANYSDDLRKKKNFFQKICKKYIYISKKKKKKNFKKYAKSEYSEKIKKNIFCIKYAKSIISEKKHFLHILCKKYIFYIKATFGIEFT